MTNPIQTARGPLSELCCGRDAGRATPTWLLILLLSAVSAIATPAAGQAPATDLRRLTLDDPRLFSMPIGRSGDRVIEAVLAKEDLDLGTSKTRVLLVGMSAASGRWIVDAMQSFYHGDDLDRWRQRCLFSAVPDVHVGLEGRIACRFPPTVAAYDEVESVECVYLWRWLGMHAPDLIVEVEVGTETGWFIPSSPDYDAARLRARLHPHLKENAGELVSAAVASAACDTGRIPALRLKVSSGASKPVLVELLSALDEAEFKGPSPARREIQTRLARSPMQVARQLVQHYGHDLNQVVYIPALALIGRLEYGELASDESQRRDVERIVALDVAGQRDSKPTSGSGLSGHLIYSQLALRSQGASRQRYLELARQAADMGFDAAGNPRESMPFHSEMSDALFMGGPILAEVGRLTGDARYFEACANHLRFMRRLVLRDDGLYRHSPLDDAAWGRGNGFAALGLALCLSSWPDERADHEELLSMYRSLMNQLAARQDATGCWHQIIDCPDSYRELSCTCMITFAAARGVRRGWLDKDRFRPIVERGWAAIRQRVAPDGGLVDVCTGTGKQKSLSDYYRRPAILGPDPRGGAMALLVATEMVRLEVNDE